jgi:hypothetical protein
MNVGIILALFVAVVIHYQFLERLIYPFVSQWLSYTVVKTFGIRHTPHQEFPEILPLDR